MNFDLLIRFVVVALALSVATRYMAEGLIDAWGVDSVWLKRALVLSVNAFITWWYMFTQATAQYTYYDYAFVLLCVCSGTEALHNIINELQEYRSSMQEYTTEAIADTYSDDEDEQ